MTARLEDAYRLGERYESEYGGCAQCVLAALQDVFGVRDDAVVRAASALSGGGGGTCNGSCGAYSGAVLFFGQLAGRARDDLADPNRPGAAAKEAAADLHDRFVEAYGSVVCREVRTAATGPAGEEPRCEIVVGRAARWAAEVVTARRLA